MLHLLIILDNSLNSNWYNLYFYFINETDYTEEYKHFGMITFFYFGFMAYQPL